MGTGALCGTLFAAFGITRDAVITMARESGLDTTTLELRSLDPKHRQHGEKLDLKWR